MACLFCIIYSTVLSQEAVISVKGVPLTSYMESLIEGTCSGNAQQVSTIH